MHNTHFTMMFIINSGITFFELRKYKRNDFDVDITIAFK